MRLFNTAPGEEEEPNDSWSLAGTESG